MNKQLFILLFALLSNYSLVYAYNFEVDGVYYSITDSKKKTVEVTHNADTVNTYQLEKYSIPDKVSYNNKIFIVNRIGDRAFIGCDQVVSINLPESIKSIGNSSFGSCKKLSHIHLPNSISKIDIFAFAMCEHLESIILPSQIDSISDALFAGCLKLKHINIPDGVRYIGQKAFVLCRNLDSVSIPKSVVDLNGCATFLGCSNLKKILVSWPQPVPIHPFMFEDIGAKQCKLVVPKGMLPKYRKAKGWKDFKEIEESNF